MDGRLNYRVYVYPPESVMQNENLTLHFKLEKVHITDLDTSVFGYMSVLNLVGNDLTNVYTNFTPPAKEEYTKYRYFSYFQRLSPREVETMNLDVMPGFRFSWWYTGAELIPDREFKDEPITKLFVR